jgi:glycosyltransferase involved in cell wall biosynthesis
MRVLSVLHYNGFGGPHNRNMRVIPLLEARGIHTTVLLPDESGNAMERLSEAGIEVEQIPLGRVRRTLNPATHAKSFASYFGEVSTIRKIIRERGIDLVQVNGFGNPQSAIAAKLEDIAVVWQLLDVGFPMPFRIAMMPLVARMADVLMSTGMAVARAHPGALRFANRLVLFYPPVDLNLFKPDPHVRATARRELGLATDDLVIGTVANFNFQKNHPGYVRAAAALKQHLPQVRFVILGTTPPNGHQLAATVKRLAQQLGLAVGKDLLIKDPGRNVPKLEQAFDLFWLTSHWEGIPTSVEEASALALPVIAFDVGAVRETVENGVSGFVVPTKNQTALIHRTIELIKDPQLRLSMGEQGRRRAFEHFDATKCADVHARAFMMAIDRRRSLASAAVAQ